MNSPFPAYKGEEPFTFVCYAHDDADIVFPDMEWLHERGLNLWYDEGISGGRIWRAEIGEAIESATQMLFFVSYASLASDHCNREINDALDQGFTVVPVYIEDVELTPDLRVGLARIQAITRYLTPRALYHEKLWKALTEKHVASKTRRSIRRAARTAPITILAISFVLVALVFYVSGVSFSSRDKTTSLINPGSLAVLTFSSASDLNDQAYVAAGLSELLRRQLRRVPDLSVMSSDSSAHFDNHEPTADDIRGRLVVAHYVRGLVQRRGEAIFVEADLVDTANGTVVRSWNLEIKLDEDVDLSRVLAMDIAIAILPLKPADVAAALGEPREIKPGSYGPYLHALDLLRQTPAPSVLNTAESKLVEALVVDETFAEAHSALCDTYRSLAMMAAVSGEYLNKATASCKRALELDNTLWEVRFARGRLFTMTGEYQLSVNELRLADKLNPNNPMVQLALGIAWAYLGDVEAAETALKRGVRLDPGFWGAHADLGDFYFEHYRYPDALEEYRRVLELQPDSGYALVSLGAAHYHLGNPVEAEEMFRKAMSKNPGSTSRAYWQAANWMGFHGYFQGCYESMAFWNFEATKYTPENYLPWGELGKACHLQNTNPLLSERLFHHAIKLAEISAARNPKDWQALGILASYHARVGDFNAGARIIERMLDIAPDHPGAMELAAEHSVVVGDDIAAERYKRIAIEGGYPIYMIMRDVLFGAELSCPIAIPAESLNCSGLDINVP